MKVDEERIDQAVLGLLWLTLHDGREAWKNFDFEVMDRLHEKGLILNPVNKSKRVSLTNEGLAKAEEAFNALFVCAENNPTDGNDR